MFGINAQEAANLCRKIIDDKVTTLRSDIEDKILMTFSQSKESLESFKVSISENISESTKKMVNEKIDSAAGLLNELKFKFDEVQKSTEKIHQAYTSAMEANDRSHKTLSKVERIIALVEAGEANRVEFVKQVANVAIENSKQIAVLVESAGSSMQKMAMIYEKQYEANHQMMVMLKRIADAVVPVEEVAASKPSKIKKGK